MRRETLAAYIDLSPGAVDQYVKRGILPRPHKIGEALLWSAEEVDAAIRNGGAPAREQEDAYDIGSRRAAEIYNHGDTVQQGSNDLDPYIQAIQRAEKEDKLARRTWVKERQAARRAEREARKKERAARETK